MWYLNDLFSFRKIKIFFYKFFYNVKSLYWSVLQKQLACSFNISWNNTDEKYSIQAVEFKTLFICFLSSRPACRSSPLHVYTVTPHKYLIILITDTVAST